MILLQPLAQIADKELLGNPTHLQHRPTKTVFVSNLGQGLYKTEDPFRTLLK